MRRGSSSPSCWAPRPPPASSDGWYPACPRPRLTSSSERNDGLLARRAWMVGRDLPLARWLVHGLHRVRRDPAGVAARVASVRDRGGKYRVVIPDGLRGLSDGLFRPRGPDRSPTRIPLWNYRLGGRCGSLRDVCTGLLVRPLSLHAARCEDR